MQNSLQPLPFLAINRPNIHLFFPLGKGESFCEHLYRIQRISLLAPTRQDPGLSPFLTVKPRAVAPPLSKALATGLFSRMPHFLNWPEKNIPDTPNLSWMLSLETNPLSLFRDRDHFNRELDGELSTWVRFTGSILLILQSSDSLATC